MESEYWAAIATWVGVGASWIYVRRADRLAEESVQHQQEATTRAFQKAAAS